MNNFIKHSVLNSIGLLFEDKYERPPVSKLYEWFHELNEKYFHGTLPPIKIVYENIAAAAWAHFVYTRRYYKKTRRWYDDFNPDMMHIGFNENFSAPETNLKNSLLHEMVHYYVAMKYNYKPARHHGTEFLNEAYRVNALAKKYGEEYLTVTPTSDEIENTVSDIGLERFKKRILDEYTVGVMQYPGKWGRDDYWFFRTEEKFINQVKANYRNAVGWNFYKLQTDNPRFGVLEKICRSRISGYMSNVSEEDAINKAKRNLGDFTLTPFNPETTEKRISGTQYIIGIIHSISDSNKYFVFKTIEKFVPRLKERYLDIEFYPVKNYDIKFDESPLNQTKVRYCTSGNTVEDAITKYKQTFGEFNV